jgi:cytosolic 5'-nucleotidase 3
MDKIIINNKKEFEKKINLIKKQGRDNFHIISDFDRTLTKGFSKQGKKTNSSFAKIRDGGYMPEEYEKEAYQLWSIYYPIEKDPNLNLKIKQKKMEEWWNKHLELVIKFGLRKEILKAVAIDGLLEPRFGLFKLLKILDKNNIPLLIFSAGLGDVIKDDLESNKVLTNNIHIISNFYKFNKYGKVIGYKSKPIHPFNKNEIEVKSHPYYNKIKERKNVILLGDSIGDINMAEGIKHNCVLKIGFLNENIKENLNQYKEIYDMVILNDGTIKKVINIVEKIIN